MQTLYSCNSDPTNSSVVINVFSKELILSGRNDESLCYSLQLVELHRKECKKFQISFVINIPESNATNIMRTIYNSKSNDGVALNRKIVGLALNFRTFVFMFG